VKDQRLLGLNKTGTLRVDRRHVSRLGYPTKMSGSGTSNLKFHEIITNKGTVGETVFPEVMNRVCHRANGANPLAIVIPCHRVIGANGELKGYGGGLARTRWLLEHEQQWGGKGIH
jgi:O-6-methylguanine DNA methyltransferase